MQHADKIVIWGMSRAGKTTFAKTFVDRHYFCFDAMFNWHTIETLGLSIDLNLLEIKKECEKYNSYVLDGWHLGDPEGQLFPSGVTVYVIYASYKTIISRYPCVVPEHLSLFKQWYDIKFDARYFLNESKIIETSREEFIALTNTSL